MEDVKDYVVGRVETRNRLFEVWVDDTAFWQKQIQGVSGVSGVNRLSGTGRLLVFTNRRYPVENTRTRVKDLLEAHFSKKHRSDVLSQVADILDGAGAVKHYCCDLFGDAFERDLIKLDDVSDLNGTELAYTIKAYTRSTSEPDHVKGIIITNCPFCGFKLERLGLGQV
ncbi:MAG: hypothetical protein GY928_34230 [Colwellia sp.]|nr:hypothetical protein [Colwellia sp.]